MLWQDLALHLMELLEAERAQVEVIIGPAHLELRRPSSLQSAGEVVGRRLSPPPLSVALASVQRSDARDDQAPKHGVCIQATQLTALHMHVLRRVENQMPPDRDPLWRGNQRLREAA
jgi:hypothetical protein